MKLIHLFPLSLLVISPLVLAGHGYSKNKRQKIISQQLIVEPASISFFSSEYNVRCNVLAMQVLEMHPTSLLKLKTDWKVREELLIGIDTGASKDDIAFLIKNIEQKSQQFPVVITSDRSVSPDLAAGILTRLYMFKNLKAKNSREISLSEMLARSQTEDEVNLDARD
jgi:hypothetical protein